MQGRSIVERYKSKTAPLRVEKNSFKVASENMTRSEKEAFLKEIGREDLSGIFEGWTPKRSSKKKPVPLDQRTSIPVGIEERVLLDMEVKRLREANLGTQFSMGSYIRSKAIGSLDIEHWRSIALEELKAIDDILENKSLLKKEEARLRERIDNSYDEEDAFVLMSRLKEIESKLDVLKSKPVSRKFRLSGRMSVAEMETVKWRAQRLCLTVSDYLRRMIFDLSPGREEDAHLTLDGKRRFYISILDVAKNGWGSPPEIYECKQCSLYIDEIGALRKELNNLKY